MSCTQGIYRIISAEQLSQLGYRFTIECPEVAKVAKAGQFVHIRCEGFLLRRPISISSIDPMGGSITIVFEVRGEGTQWLATRKAGDTLDMIAPLGNGFDLLPCDHKAILIGGGIGTPPMVALAEHYGANAQAIIGFRSKDAVLLQDTLAATGATVHLCTDDGSAGHKGFVTDILAKLLKEDKPHILYACGPTPMLKAVAKLAEAHGIRCQLSLEERMGCGVGACLVCVCKIKEANGEVAHKCVCKSGPVFEAEEVEFGG